MQVIGKTDIITVIQTAEEIMRRFKKLPEDIRPEEDGGYLAIMQRTPEISNIAYRWPLVVQIGTCADRLLIRSFNLAQEKCKRLYANSRDNGHISSWQSQFPGKGKYGGSVTHQKRDGASEVICGVSGLTALQDEASATVLCLTQRWINGHDAAKIRGISNNLLIEPLAKACQGLFIH